MKKMTYLNVIRALKLINEKNKKSFFLKTYYTSFILIITHIMK